MSGRGLLNVGNGGLNVGRAGPGRVAVRLGGRDQHGGYNCIKS